MKLTILFIIALLSLPLHSKEKHREVVVCVSETASVRFHKDTARDKRYRGNELVSVSIKDLRSGKRLRLRSRDFIDMSCFSEPAPRPITHADIPYLAVL